MDNSRSAKIKRAHRKLINTSASKTKKCYIIACSNPTIKAHSISNKQLLLKIAENGEVMYFNKDGGSIGELVKTGRGIATVFNGFCGEHDKVFHPIDNEDYVPGNKEQEYLFAMRAAAKEYTTRQTVSNALAVRDTDDVPDEVKEFPIADEMVELFEEFRKGFDVGTNDQAIYRGIFNDTLIKSKFNVIQTSVIVADGELPVAVSGSFNMELDIEGNLINDVSNAALSTKMKPCFMTVFPQNGKTYCLVSYLRKDRADYEFLNAINNMDNVFKQTVISNLTAGYVENFVASPTYWNGLDSEVRRAYADIFGVSFKKRYVHFLTDKSFNLFP